MRSSDSSNDKVLMMMQVCAGWLHILKNSYNAKKVEQNNKA